MARSVAEIKARMARVKSDDENRTEIRPGYERLDELKRRTNRDAYHQSQSESINGFLQGAQNYFSGFQKKLDSMTWENASQVNDQITSDVSKMLRESEEVRRYLSTYGDRLGEDTVTSLTESLDALESARVQAQSVTESRRNYFASFDSEEDYIRRAYENSDKRQQRYASNQERIAALNAEWDAYEHNWTDATQRAAAEDRHAQIKGEIAALEAENLKYERGEDGYTAKATDDHRATTQNADFEEVSANRGYANPTREEIELADAMNDNSLWDWDEVQGVYRDSFGNELAVDENGTYYNPAAQQIKVEDKLALYLNASEDDRVSAARNTGGMREGIWTSVMREGYDGAWEYLSEEEQKIYYYYLAESQETANQYLADMKVELNRRRTLDEMGQWSQQYASSGFLGKAGMNLFSVPAQFASSITGTIDDVISSASGKDTNPYSLAHRGMHYSQTVRGETASELDKIDFKIPVVDYTLGDIYQVGMSRLDSALATGIGGKLGTVLLGLSAAQNETYRLYTQGATETQATLGGLCAGAAEMVFEYASFDKLIKMGDSETVVQWVKNALIQGGIEASEEGFTEISNIVTNAIIMGQQSDLAELYAQNKESAWNTFLDLTKQVAQSSFGGFLGGVSAGGVEAGGSYIYNQGRFRNAGSVVMGSEGAVERLTALANELDGISSYKLGKQAQAVAQKATKKNVGRLFSDISRTVTEQNSKELSARLAEKGIDAGRASQIAEAVLTERTDSYGLTQEQTKLLRSVESDSRVAEAVREILDTEGSAAYQRNAQLEAIQADVKESALTQLARETVEARYDAENGVGLEGIASTEGKAILDDEAVDVVDIADAGGGKVSLQLRDGRTADAAELSFPDSGEAELWRVIGKYAEDADSARALLEVYRNGNVDAFTYARGIEEAFLYGKVNLSPREMELQGTFVNKLSPTQRNMAYQQGNIAGQKKAQQTRQQQENINSVYKQAKSMLQQKGTDVGEHSVQLADGLTVEKMGKTQRASYELAQQIAPAVKADIRIYNGGKEWGYYDHKTDTICLNINAKWSNVSMMTFTLAHELVHRAKAGSPAKYEAFANFLIQQYGMQGASVNSMVQEQLQAAEEAGISMTYEAAFEEVICDACQKMLVDTDAGKRLAEFGAKSAQNKNIVKQLGQWLKDLLRKLRRIFRNVEPDSLAAQEFQMFDDNVKQILADMFVDMSMDAGEKLSTIKAAGMIEKITTDKGGVKYKLPVESKTPTYQELVNKEPIAIINIGQNKANLSYADIKKQVLKNAIDKKVFDKPHLNKDTGVSIFLTPASYSHAFSNPTADFGVDTLLAMDHITEIINEAVLTHIEGAKNPLKAEKRVLTFFAAVEGENGVEPIKLKVKEYNEQNPERLPKNIRKYFVENGVPETHNRLYDAVALEVVAIEGTKKESGASASGTDRTKRKVAKGTPNSIIKIAELLDLVNGDAKKYVPQDETGKRNKLPASKDAADRGMLVDLFEQMVTDSEEHRALQNYKKNINRMLALEEQVDRLTEEIKRVSFAEGPRNMEYLDNLKAQRKKAVAELNRYDNILLGLEKSGVLRSMIERNRATAIDKSYKKAREYYREKNEKREAEIRQYYRESRRKAVERHNQAEVRQRIRKDVQRLDSLLNKGTKEKNVKLELQEFAGAALRTAKGVFLKNYSEYDMIRNGVNATMSREQKAVFERCQVLLKELDQIWEEKNNEPAPDSFHEKWDPEETLRRDDREEALKKELAKNMKILRDADIFQVENELMEDANAEQLMTELLTAYKALQDSESAHVREVFSSTIYDHIDSVRETLKGKAIKDMNAEELADLHKMYRLVLHTINTSNDLFAQKRKGDVRKLGEEIISQLQTPGKEMIPEILDKLAKMGWANLKPETALELIGSEALTGMMQGLYHGEDTYALDIDNARKYAQEQGKKYGRDKWDMKKSLVFANTTITLGEAMSLYAYTRRRQAQGHLEGDGFTHSTNVRIKKPVGKLPVELSYIRNATKTHTVTKDVYDRVAALLTPEQKKYVEAMQEYLSKVMGAKGNEVSMQLYGIPLFLETVYFPLKTAKEYHDEALGATKGEVKLRNSGFTQKVQEKASNPIVLDDFESVWAAHVDKMSLYHGFVLPMEDFDRVYNYHRTVEEDVTDAQGEVYKTRMIDTNETVKVDIENKMGKAATDYIEDFMRQLNGGVRSDPVENLFASGVRNFKKAAVMGSLSVAVQQPTAFIRAMAYLDVQDVADWKRFLGKEGKPDGRILDEMYKYAPVALMKHIGGFDPGLGRSTQNYIFGDKGVMEAVDAVAGWLPEHMDQWTWTYIWICTKRQIHRQNPALQVNSQEFLQKVGERFSQIIRDTQVYDSVLTKSRIMRSKNVFLQMATAFMNEPTTSLDMYIRSAVQAKRGKISKKKAAKRWGAVVGSQILVAAVSAFVYAARDDDEDETYWEKYVRSFVSKTKEGLLPFYSIPFVKDIFSVFEGYDVERSDMSLITDLYQGWNKLKSGNATPWEKVEAFAGSILNCFGIPLKNVSRDVRAIFNTVKVWGDVSGTSTGMRYAAQEGLTGIKASKKVQLEKAVTDNDVKHILRVMASYNTEERATSDLRTAVKDMYLVGKITADRAAEFLQTYAGDSKMEAQEKVTVWMTVWEFKREHPDSKLTEGKILDYVEFAEPAGISLKVFTQYTEATADIESVKDENGKTVTSKQEKMWMEIHKLSLSKTQKDALHYAAGYKESSLDDAPWH